MAAIPSGSEPHFFKVITSPSDQGLVSMNGCFFVFFIAKLCYVYCDRCNIVLTALFECILRKFQILS